MQTDTYAELQHESPALYENMIKSINQDEQLAIQGILHQAYAHHGTGDGSVAHARATNADRHCS